MFLSILGLLPYAFLTVLAFMIGIPLAFNVYPSLCEHILFLNFRRLKNCDYENPQVNGILYRVRNFYLKGEDGRIGVWHIAPKNLLDSYEAMGEYISDDEMERSLTVDHFPIVLYSHGNSFDRASSHRIELYNLLATHSYHVITYDYRGYGDSDGHPTEDGIVTDGFTVYQYIKALTSGKVMEPTDGIVLWGHSMGTAVTAQLANRIIRTGDSLLGIVLESPFNNLYDAIRVHPLAYHLRCLSDSMFEKLILNAFRRANLTMASDQHMQRLGTKCPVLILHAEDDLVIPFELGLDLYRIVGMVNHNTEFAFFDAIRGYAHKYICRAPELPVKFNAFVDRCRQWRSDRSDFIDQLILHNMKQWEVKSKERLVKSPRSPLICNTEKSGIRTARSAHSLNKSPSKSGSKEPPVPRWANKKLHISADVNRAMRIAAERAASNGEDGVFTSMISWLFNRLT